ncbi:hypothetical protein FA95DRAFT_1609839 [Auriscalpium vulgare]|uniref:Uncharacterized protein n=1 Tax=Auriscalpium vulgare TaxID=40419 RepID=A0ACB8RFI8_9AGAM|nr:hypothetical protein FA95DRAFT_1609839 [Auriscalpium vulgare]
MKSFTPFFTLVLATLVSAAAVAEKRDSPDAIYGPGWKREDAPDAIYGPGWKREDGVCSGH